MLQRTALCAALLLLMPGLASGLTAPPALDALEESDREALERIARQPAPLRNAALRASQHVDVLVETQRIQEASSAEFQGRIEGLERAQQEQVWEIVREPGLLDELAGAAPRSAAELEASVARHPDVPADAIREIGARYAPLLAEVQRIQRRADSRFEVLLADLPDAAARDAFRDLLDAPELLSLLARRVELVVRLGDSYAADAETTRAHLAALGEQVIAEEERARDAWVQSIADDPEAAEELEASARAYAEENGVDYEELTDPEVRTRVQIVVHPYPYWFGYPLWYSDLYLYPYGYWYPYPVHFGFYHHHRYHNYVWFGFPSPGYLFWFFSGHHHDHYAHLSHGFDSHYRHHRHAHTSFHTTLASWSHWKGRDHHHRGFSGRHDGHRSDGHRSGGHGGGDGGVFVSLFERARFAAEDDGHRSHDGARGDGDRDRRGDRARGGDREGRSGSDAGRPARGSRGHGWDGERRDIGSRGGDREDRSNGDAARPEGGDRGRPDRWVRPDPQATERDDRSPPAARSDDGRGRGDDGRGRGGRAEGSRAGGRDASPDVRVDRPDPQREGSRVRIRDHRSETRSSQGHRSSGREGGMQRSDSRRERGFSPRGGGRLPDVSSRGRSGGSPRVGRGGGSDRGSGGHRGGGVHRGSSGHRGGGRR